MQKLRKQAILEAMIWKSLAIGAILIAALGLFIRSRLATTYHIGMSEIPWVLNELSVSTSTPAFAVFMFNSPDRPAQDDVLNVQFSMENGHPGFDWVLIAPRNIADKQRFVDFARAAGYQPKSLEGNGVKYLRVEDGDLAQLCKAVIVDMYKVPMTATIDMIVAGFEWKS